MSDLKQRYIELARKAGSSATTFVGARRFLSGWTPKQMSRFADRTWGYTWYERVAKGERQSSNPQRTAAQVANYYATLPRLQDADAKKAKAMPAYRAKRMRQLRDEQAKLLAPPTTLDGLQKWHANRAATQARLREISHWREIATGKPQAKTALPRLGVLVPIDESTARNLGAKLDMRGKDAQVLADWTSYLDHQEGHTEWRNGRPKSYTRATRDNHVRSFALISSPQVVLARLVTRDIAVQLPDGYRWDIDANGLRAVSVANEDDDYHVSASDLFVSASGIFGGLHLIVGKLRANAARRAVQAEEDRKQRAALEGVYVCFADALRAGNCQAGSLAWCQRNNISLTTHVPASLLQRLDPQNPRVRITISAAARQHQIDMERGYSLLAEHGHAI